MKFLNLRILLCLLLIILLSGCGGGSSGTPNPTATPGGGITFTPGQSVTYTIGSGASAVSFKMNYAPSGSFASDDNTVCNTTNVYPTTVQVSKAFWIAQTDVTYQLWYAVYTWATTGCGQPEAGQYHFQNSGREGSMGTNGAAPTTNKQHPVTWISWRDAMVWCNALTDYYNATYRTSLICVYSSNGVIIRDSTNGNATVCDNVTAKATAKGFRLPTIGEWELTARYQDGTNWTPGDHVSGDMSGYCYNSGISNTASSIFGNYAWYDGNCSSTMPVGQKIANFLGLYDMCGNVEQWCFDPGSIIFTRLARGGGWIGSAKGQQLGFVSPDSPDLVFSFVGFRLVQTQ